MNNNDFRKNAHELVDWMADYFEQVEEYPVKPKVEPGDILQQLSASAPEESEDFNAIFEDFKQTIMPGMTHWESPNFMGYFPANKSYPSVLAEMLTATLGAQCMSWLTSPAATELEEQVMEWLRQLLDLPESFSGVIQGTASTSTLCALLMARERASDFEINANGFQQNQKLKVYCSTQTHSSIEKDVKIAGFGKNNLQPIPVDNQFAMRPKALEDAIKADLEKGCMPAVVIATLGTTGSTAIDPLQEIGAICERYDLFLHVDAAYAGTAMLLPEMRWMAEGMEQADSFVFNPHKWMFTNFDCSAFYVQDVELLIRTFSILPEYLKTAEDQHVKNYRDWGIPLGRRFRALKLWFVMRSFGAGGLRKKVRRHIDLGQQLEVNISDHPNFELLAPVPLNLLCFRFHPEHITNKEELNTLNEQLLHNIQESGELFLTHTKLDGQFALRMVIGNTNVKQRHVEAAWRLIQKEASLLVS